jgi:RHS repeat-associated protein
VVALSDGRGRVVQDYEYDSYGNLHDRKNRIKQPYSYTGREYDRETGLYYYRARYYDSGVGRFVNKDPIGFSGGDVNLFNYVQNNPIIFVDPNGLFIQRFGQYIPYLIDKLTNLVKGMTSGTPGASKKDELIRLFKEVEDRRRPWSKIELQQAIRDLEYLKDLNYQHCINGCSNDPCPDQCMKKCSQECTDFESLLIQPLRNNSDINMI